ncbi:MAG: DNA polymerase IV [Deltaproteobacteria bacterium]|nr:DNA polymerase IV [Deltaproteobacteria bacterium]
MRRVLHVDMDAFFAAVEEKRDPSLKGKPIVIGGTGDPTRRGVVATASYEARTYGIHSAMPLKTAFKCCPHAVFLPVNYETYVKESKAFKELLLQITPVMEDVGIDEVFLDISDISAASESIAEKIKERIRTERSLSCSIGIAPNKLLAKIASDMQKPDGLTIIAPENIEAVLAPMPVRKIWGIGPKTEMRLKEMGIETVRSLTARSLENLIDSFGISYGHYLYQASRGIDDSSLITSWEPKSISRESTFQKDIGNWQIIARMLADLTKEVVEEMRDRDFRTRTVTVKIRFADFETLTRGLTLPEPVNGETEIRKAAFACLKRIDLAKKVRLVGVRVGNLGKIES